MFLIFDTETTGLPRDYNAPLTRFDNWPRLVQIAWQLHDATGKLLEAKSFLVKPEGFSIPFNATKIHGITNERAQVEGLPIIDVLTQFIDALQRTNYLAGHNIEFDCNVVGCEFLRSGNENFLEGKKQLDTKELATDYCEMPGGRGGKYKWPTLTELHQKLFGEKFIDAHDAAFDVSATGKCFFELIKQNIFRVAEIPNAHAVVYEAPVLDKSNFAIPDSSPPQAEANSIQVETAIENKSVAPNLEPGLGSSQVEFVHLHVHSQYSVLQSTTEIDSLIKLAKNWNMPAVAITDSGNLMGAFEFSVAAEKTGIKAIIGCELNVCADSTNKSVKDDGYATVFLAKNKNGYQNLSKLSSYAYTKGFYYVPRIDRDILLQYKDDLIVLSGNLWGEISSLILNVGEEQAEQSFIWWKEIFGEDYYAELCRHNLEEEDVANRTIIQFCEKHGVKYVATNNSFYTNREDADAQDALICVKEGEYVSRPKKFIGKRGREFRFGFPNDEFYLKSAEEMSALFSDLPDAISNTVAIADKCESYALNHDVLLPKFPIPSQFMDDLDKSDGGKRGEMNYLRHLTYEGAKKKYGEITSVLEERIKFELDTIEMTKYPGYFLIVHDFCAKAREMGVSVGPGRGSAAGSVVAYSLGITNIEPMKYDLLFERFLNPERVSMPDIDIDFDDRGRDKVIDYVRKTYGENQVAQIITYGTMAAKSSIRDAGRVFELPLPDTDKLSKLVPDRMPEKWTLKRIVESEDAEVNKAFDGEDGVNVKKLRGYLKEDSKESTVVKMAAILEGSVRNLGTHACGVIITPGPITDYVPVAVVKDSEMWCTQFDNAVVESAGLLKMDFLGLSTLTLITDVVELVKQNQGIELKPDDFPLDDEKTFQLFQRGEMVGVFQYESDGMQKHLKNLKPTTFDDLIAMNALYRPGPMEYIPNFIKRKNGEEEISYDLPEMEEFLSNTYGITVYQEQVMLLSQKLANFSKGEADTLRKAMGKKQKSVLDKMKGKFIEGASANGHPADTLEKIWTDWEAFASYAFNKSHSTCYAFIAFQTAYLKTHYPSEFMAAVLSQNLHDISQLGFFMNECKRMSLPVLGPDVNESQALFAVNKKGEIRFGLAGIKGVGESAVASMVKERMTKPFSSIYDFLERVDSKSSSKKVLEGLALAGALDSFKINRAAYFAPDGKTDSFVETLIRYSNSVREKAASNQGSLFGESSDGAVVKPAAPKVESWDTLTQLSKEKEVVGMFISGHPLDDYAIEIKNFCSEGGISLLQDMEANRNREIRLAGMVTDFANKVAKQSQKPYGIFTLQDYNDEFKFFLFGEDYLKYKDYMMKGFFLFIQGRIQPRRTQGQETNELEFRIQRLELLADVKEKLARFIDVKVNLENVTETLVNQISTTLKNGKGKTQVRFRIIDQGAELPLPSLNTTKVEITNDVMKELEKIGVVEVGLAEG